MKTLKLQTKDPAVFMLGEILKKLGYEVSISNLFGMDIHNAVIDYQKKNNLVIDGIVGLKTWEKLWNTKNSLPNTSNKFLSENDLIEFAEQYQIDLAAVKAVNEVESSGKGFLLDGRPRILFEGHIFWKQLLERGINPSNYVSEDSKNILYKNWTKKYYQGGVNEYQRLEKAASLDENPKFSDAAFASSSFGSFQIMGFQYKDLGYETIGNFVNKMNVNEKEHLEAFGRFCVKRNLVKHLKSKNWAAFAEGYNGAGYKQNKYDIKMKAAYDRHNA